jgi:hypothetical protein
LGRPANSVLANRSTSWDFPLQIVSLHDACLVVRRRMGRRLFNRIPPGCTSAARTVEAVTTRSTSAVTVGLRWAFFDVVAAFYRAFLARGAIRRPTGKLTCLSGTISPGRSWPSFAGGEIPRFPRWNSSSLQRRNAKCCTSRVIHIA